MMKHTIPLTAASLLSILLTTLHVTDDVMRGMAPGTLSTFAMLVPILVVWLYGTMVLAERRSGYVIILLGSLLGILVAILHLRGAGVGGTIAKSSGGFFFIWTIMALAVTSLFSVILATRGLWVYSSRRNPSAQRGA